MLQKSIQTFEYVGVLPPYYVTVLFLETDAGVTLQLRNKTLFYFASYSAKSMRVLFVGATLQIKMRGTFFGLALQHLRSRPSTKLRVSALPPLPQKV